MCVCMHVHSLHLHVCVCVCVCMVYACYYDLVDQCTQLCIQQVQASHILVKHKESRRPSSWKQENISRSKDEALEILKGIK